MRALLFSSAFSPLVLLICTHSFSRFLSTEQRRRDTETKKNNFESVFVNTNEGGGVFLRCVSLSANDCQKKKKNESDESRAATEKYSRDELASSFTPSSRESHEKKKKKKKKKRTIIVFPRSPLRARY